MVLQASTCTANADRNTQHHMMHHHCFCCKRDCLGDSNQAHCIVQSSLDKRCAAHIHQHAPYNNIDSLEWHKQQQQQQQQASAKHQQNNQSNCGTVVHTCKGCSGQRQQQSRHPIVPHCQMSSLQASRWQDSNHLGLAPPLGLPQSS